MKTTYATTYTESALGQSCRYKAPEGGYVRAIDVQEYFIEVERDPNARRALHAALNEGVLHWSPNTASLRTRTGSSTSSVGGTLAAIIEYVDRGLEQYGGMFDEVDYTPAPEQVSPEWTHRLLTVSSIEDDTFVLDWTAGELDSGDVKGA